MRIGVLGTGNVARTVGAGWAAVGHDVFLGSRTPESKRELGLPVVGLIEAATRAEVVVNATSGRASLEVLTGIGAAPLAGKILIDVALAVTPERDIAYPNSSLGEKIQERFPKDERRQDAEQRPGDVDDRVRLIERPEQRLSFRRRSRRKGDSRPATQRPRLGPGYTDRSR